MSRIVYFYGNEEEVKALVHGFSFYYNVNYEQGKNSWKIEIVSPKKVSEILNGMPDKVKKAMYQMLKPKFASSASSGRKKINLPSKEELQTERQSLSVAQLAKKYNCSVTTINRRLGLIKKKG
ncbi:HTH domain-containing protein [Faecalitalea cylindroides]|uniref:HTH domain-containing protein n=1 Tax=Erysipelotrichaceae TaxID=128827 RepID=UPI001897BC5B|nr:MULTISPECIES: HTH domain-containing protein [Erysipelotrichaceae]MDB7947739.1 HTH domain-containing protein [Faecalitalea cylindroides]MDB7949609.1 HTH domain-containing protein [Faecalitalea cylindroides]MDB7951469.1 HTH domain-containing protein [Faecalitalea cylindroides]